MQQIRVVLRALALLQLAKDASDHGSPRSSFHSLLRLSARLGVDIISRAVWNLRCSKSRVPVPPPC